MIDVYVPEGVLPSEKIPELLGMLTDCLLRWTDATELPLARDNTGAFLHVLPSAHVRAGGQPAAVVRIDVKLPAVVLSTIERRRGFIADATAIVTLLRVDLGESRRTWITVSNTADGGWGINGHGLTNAELDEL